MYRRDAAAVFVVTLLLLNFMPLLTDDGADAHVYDDGRELSGVLFYEVAPTNACEGFALKNYGNAAVSLSGYTVKLDPYAASKNVFDLKGTIGPGDVAVFAKKVSDMYWFTSEEHVGEYDRDVYRISSVDPGLSGFSLGNSAGQLYLYGPDGILDTVCYKSGSGPSKFEPVSTVSWSGAPAYLGKTDDAIRRVELKDTNTSFDWIPAGPGMTSNGYSDVPSFDVQVQPFVFPDSSGRYVYDAIAGASEYIHISIYMLTSPNIVSLLCRMADQGVQVRLMLEDKPLGYGHSAYLLKELDGRANAEVRFIGADDNLDRYSYVHNKYMVVDGDTVVITSENWTIGNMQCIADTSDGNRGWGAAVYGPGFAQYVENEYFSSDWTYGDTVPLSERAWGEKDDVTTDKPLPSDSKVDSYMSSLRAYSTQKYSASVSLYMSPDNTFKALSYLMSNAEDRIYTEQMDVGTSYSDLANDGPLRYMAQAALKGVDARFLTTDKEAKVLTDMINSETNIRAAKMANTGYATMHNKGVIIDDKVWVSSVNWTENSFINNRECGLLITSKAVSDFYAESYTADWDASYRGSYDSTIRPDKVPVQGETSALTLQERNGALGDWTVHYKNGDVKTYPGLSSLNLEYSDDLAYVVFESSDGQHRAKYVFGSMPADEGTGLTTVQYVEIGAGSLIVLLILALIRKFRKH